MSLINISKLTFAHEGSCDNIFTEVDLQLDTDWKLGFTGRNGRGKTTFLNLLMGSYEYSGQISSTVEFEYFPYQVTNPTELTLQVIETICPEIKHWELVRELGKLEVNAAVLHQQFATLSSGERTKILLAVLFLKENKFLLIDEPTNHLDLLGRETVSRYLQSKRGFILVSHDRNFLDACIDHILSINKTNIEVQRGNFSSWLLNKERQDAFELAENERLKKDIKRLNAAAKRTDKWSSDVEKTKFGTKNSGIKPDKGRIGHKAAKMMQRSKNIEARQQDAIEDKSKLLKNIETAEKLKLRQIRHHSSRLVTMKNLSILYGEKTVCQGVNLLVEQGERIAIQGRNGAGKTSILKLICGESIAYTGTLQVASQLQVSYVAQDTGYLRGSLSEFARVQGLDQSLFLAILRKLDFARVQFEKDMQQFSDGQKKKVLIASSLCEQKHLLVWDEPLNFVDVLSRMQIEQLLLTYQPTIIFVEHDSAFCDSIVTRRVFL